MTLDRYGSLVLAAERAFDDFCIENNIENPCRQLTKIKMDTINFTPHPCKENCKIINTRDYTEFEKEKMKKLEKKVKPFKEKKEKFIIDYILKKSTYGDVVTYCLQNNLTEYLNIIAPCEDSTKQCDLGCPFLNDCTKEKNIDKKVEALETWF